jgi:hypothetical protein
MAVWSQSSSDLKLATHSAANNPGRLEEFRHKPERLLDVAVHVVTVLDHHESPFLQGMKKRSEVVGDREGHPLSSQPKSTADPSPWSPPPARPGSRSAPAPSASVSPSTSRVKPAAAAPNAWLETSAFVPNFGGGLTGCRGRSGSPILWERAEFCPRTPFPSLCHQAAVWGPLTQQSAKTESRSVAESRLAVPADLARLKQSLGGDSFATVKVEWVSVGGWPRSDRRHQRANLHRTDRLDRSGRPEL